MSEPLPAALSGYGGELGSLVHSVSDMKSRLAGIVHEVFTVGDKTASAVSRLESDIEDLNGNLQEISAATQQLTGAAAPRSSTEAALGQRPVGICLRKH